MEAKDFLRQSEEYSSMLQDKEDSMRISIKNLGAVREADFDLKPLTIFIGPNNSGKTWLAYTTAGILSQYGFMQYLKAYSEGRVSEKYILVEEMIENFFATGNATLNLLQFLEDESEHYLNHVAQFAHTWMQDFMSTDRVMFDDLSVHIDLAKHKTALLEKVRNARINARFPLQKPLVKARKESGGDSLYVYVPGNDVNTISSLVANEDESILSFIPEAVTREFVCAVIFQQIHQALYPNTYLFPTERSTFVTLPFQALSQEILSGIQEEDQFQQTGNIRPAIWPINSFLGMMEGLHLLNNEKARTATKQYTAPAYKYMARYLEEHILKGRLDFSEEDRIPDRSICFYPNNPQESSKKAMIDMPIASSMVKELAPLALYLRYFARKGDLIVIDEPEMNLHPEAQVQVLEFLAILVNAGIRVLLTTHSPYFLDHLSNLIKGHDNANQEAISQLFFLKNKDAFLKVQDVAVYLVENGTIQSAIDEEGTLEWPTFTDVANKISEIYFSL